MLERCRILQPCRNGMQLRNRLLGNAIALQSHKQGVSLAAIVDGFDNDAAAICARGSDGIDRTGFPAFGYLRGNLVEEALAIRTYLESRPLRRRGYRSA